MYKNKKISVIIAAAGAGKRMNGGLPKQYLKIGGQVILVKTINAFFDHKAIDDICVVVNKDYVKYCNELLKSNFEREELSCIRVVEGGSERQHSVYEALKRNECNCDYVLIHDGARPFVHRETIDNVIKAAVETGAAVAAVPLTDTIRNEEKTLDRAGVYRVQTPQGFERGLLIKAYEKAFEEGYLGTDDASLAERLGKKIAIVEGTYDNIKITTKEDLPMENYIGTGYDAHRLTEGRRLILGGVDIPFEKGLLGHSDADVLSHAVMDAILGGAAMGDIGKHFPDSDDKYKGISGMVLLKKVKKIIEKEGFAIGNIDVTLIAQRPKIAGYIDEMKDNISSALELDKHKINIKGTTTEGMGFTGREEGIAAQAICILTR